MAGKKQMTAEEAAYIERVKNLDCVCCNAHGPSSAHHPRLGHGIAERAPHFTAIALCHDCHQGPNGIHGNRSMMRIMKLDELDMIGRTVAGVMRNILGNQR